MVTCDEFLAQRNRQIPCMVVRIAKPKGKAIQPVWHRLLTRLSASDQPKTKDLNVTPPPV